jgi:hypothetical protein
MGGDMNRSSKTYMEESIALMVKFTRVITDKKQRYEFLGVIW